MAAAFSLQKRGAEVVLTSSNDETAGIPVHLTYARPLSMRDEGISIIDAESKSELYWIDQLSDLDAQSQTIANAALADRYRISIIESVVDSHVNHGHRYLKVMTDRGERYFNLREPGKNITHFSDDHLVIRDSMGNRYEIPSLSALDPESQERIDRVL
ncbi:MAG: hypothetical protein ACI9R3_002299 [Verrucomicrobiales bacterium]